MLEDSQTLVPGGRLMAEALKAGGVDVLFTGAAGNGSGLGGLLDGCAHEGIEVVGVRDEQMATHAADGYARITGRPGCAVIPAGAGTTGAATALHAGSPLLLVGAPDAAPGNTADGLHGRTAVDLMRPVTKYAATVPDTAHVTERVATALRECRDGAPGPSYLEIPGEVLDATAPARVPGAGDGRDATRGPGDPGAVEELAGLVVRSRRPVLLLGGPPWTARGTDDAVELVRTLGVPAYLTGAARGTLPPGDPHLFHLSRRYAVANADLVLVVGTPFGVRTARGTRLPAHATVVRIDLDPRAVGTSDGPGAGVDLGIGGDPGLVLASVTRTAAGRPDNGSAERKVWLDELRDAERIALDKLLPQLTSDASPVHPYRLAREVDDFLTADSFFIGDGGDLLTLASQVVRPRSPGHWLDAGPLGTPGVGVPFVLAARRARPDQEAVVLFDDEALAASGPDLASLGVPFVGIVGGTRGHPHHDTFARTTGARTEEVRDPDGIAPALTRARESGLPSLINVWVDPDAYAPGFMPQTMYK